MLELSTISATVVAGPSEALRTKRILARYDGPLTCEQTDARGNTYLYHWCDADETSNRWLLVWTTRDRIDAVVTRRTPLRDALTSSEKTTTCWLVDVPAANADATYYEPRLTDIPEEYLPESNIFLLADEVEVIDEDTIDGRPASDEGDTAVADRPETMLERWLRLQPSHTLLTDFLDWCSANGLDIGEYGASLVPKTLQTLDSRRPHNIACLFLGIDQQALERERRELLRQAAGST